MKRIYVAGPITPTGEGNPAIEYLENKRKGTRIAVELILAGFAPYCPMIDDDFWMVLKEGEQITAKMIYNVSLAQLEGSDAMFLMFGWSSSKGTVKEIERAVEKNIPIFQSISNLIAYFKEH